MASHASLGNACVHLAHLSGLPNCCRLGRHSHQETLEPLSACLQSPQPPVSAFCLRCRCRCCLQACPHACDLSSCRTLSLLRCETMCMHILDLALTGILPQRECYNVTMMQNITDSGKGLPSTP